MTPVYFANPQSPDDAPMEIISKVSATQQSIEMIGELVSKVNGGFTHSNNTIRPDFCLVVGKKERRKQVEKKIVRKGF